MAKNGLYTFSLVLAAKMLWKTTKLTNISMNGEGVNESYCKKNNENKDILSSKGFWVFVFEYASIFPLKSRMALLWYLK